MFQKILGLAVVIAMVSLLSACGGGGGNTGGETYDGPADQQPVDGENVGFRTEQ